MKPDLVVFITLNDYDNLGVGYMAAVLTEAGYKTKIIDPRRKKSYILYELKKNNPLLVGFSIIFLNHIDLFADLSDYLRKGGINCHFTAGGHYASLRSEELFKKMPDLNSIVKFEGEYSLLELINAVRSGNNWKDTKGIAYRENHLTVSNQLPPIENDLDKFPFPCRSPLKKYAFDKKYATILAGRGCRSNCSFCNTKEFYRQAAAPVKRIRRPEIVVDEMEYLYRKKKCSVFIFHDDDFPVSARSESEWLKKFCYELQHRGFRNKIMWKINCRPDEVDMEKFALMKQNGLFLVFIGLEDGTDIGLSRLNKNMTVMESLTSINILKKLKIGFDFGFLLFQPDTTYKSLIENIGFLKKVCGDGYTPVTFLRLLALYDTPVEKDLRRSGRLLSAEDNFGYEFIDVSMNRYYDFVIDCFAEWMRDSNGIENISKWARNYFSVYMHFNEPDPDEIKYNARIKRIISKSNLFFLDILKELALLFEAGTDLVDENNILDNYRRYIKAKHDYYRKKINCTMTEFLNYLEDKKASFSL